MSPRTSDATRDADHGAIPRVRGILETCLHVADVEASARFYEQLFGFQRMAGDTRFCAFAVAPQAVLLLFLRGGSLQPITISGGVIPPHDGSGRLHLAFAIAAENITAWEERLAAADIPIESRVHWEHGGHSVYFRDPDDHLVELATPGIWPNY